MLAVALVAWRGEDAPTQPVAYVLACVDSGAHRSLFPLAIAIRLGLTPTELTKDPEPAGGVGSVFETWTSSVPIRGMVLREFEHDGKPASEPWGPAFEIAPGFAALPQMLLGRADFFKAFSVNFCDDTESPGDSCFEITPR